VVQLDYMQSISRSLLR